MIQLSGENWYGNLLFDTQSKARGRVHGYSWYLQSKNNSLIIEISEDPSIPPEELPLVGYGCGGWLFECEQISLANNKIDFVNYINEKLSFVFEQFSQNKLKYLAPVSCPCSE
ncbi:hypothetical protein CW745_07090 [Psychromonas sp. psych-6C06]|uniref:hypothetical protein n=1 Tax=Psychromonas sp. psych-6C06 TaxID=2058089 RepID=UPI000C3436A2|nr:hypothetical protein [Psychromonas sp. psych-6C06]PKF62321.1 hypothetical protein CW745_07090 [Psychromonas sp. psych-6C06]